MGISILTSTRPRNDKKSLDTFCDGPGDTPGLDAAVERGRILAESQNFTRAMVNEPANLLTPLDMAEAAGKMAAEFGLECEVLDRAAMEKLGMGVAARGGAWAAPNRRP